MEDPLFDPGITQVVLSESIKFLYQQAGEVLKRWRERRTSGRSKVTGEARLDPPAGVFANEVEPVGPNDNYANELELPLRESRRALSDYADSIELADVEDPQFLAQFNALRSLLETIYGQQMTFVGEERNVSWPVVRGEIDVGSVDGMASGVQADVIEGGNVHGRAVAQNVACGGELSGVKVKKIT